MILKIIAVIVTLLNGWSALLAATPTATLEIANQAYQKADFAKAIKQYEQLLQENYKSEVIYYNLGNSYYRVNQFGKAILNYERALRLAPKDADTRHNLQIVRSKLIDKIEPLPEFFLFKWWTGWSNLLSANSWSVLSLVLLWLGVGGLSVWLLDKIRNYKKWGFVIGIILLTFSLLSFAFTYSNKQILNDDTRAVLLQKEIILRAAPDEKSAAVLTLHEGVIITLKDKIGNWYKIALDNGEQGWVSSGSFELVKTENK